MERVTARLRTVSRYRDGKWISSDLELGSAQAPARPSTALLRGRIPTARSGNQDHRSTRRHDPCQRRVLRRPDGIRDRELTALRKGRLVAAEIACGCIGCPSSEVREDVAKGSERLSR